MGHRTLESRLTRRLLALAGAVLVAVGVAAVLVTDRVLEASEESAARAYASGARDALARELAEGDAFEEAVNEVTGTADAKAVRLTVRRASAAPRSAGAPLPEVAAGACAVVDEQGALWRACSLDGPGATIVAAVPMAGHRAAIAALERGMVAVVLAALLALWWAVRRALRGPVAELTSLVGWTARIVDTEQPASPPPSATREISELETAFDTLVRRLLDTLVRERANSAHIAHELRTPLTAAVAELESLRLQDDASREAVARVRADMARLAAVIDAILVLSGPRDQARGAAILNVADLARELAPSGTTVEAPDEALVEGDEHLVALALRNLVDNARKHGSGVRSVHVSREADAVRVAVVDGGHGLDAAARARMFDRYWRGTADGDGSGLGLALVRAVAERHGGRAEARPGPEGRGLDVSITLKGLVGWQEQPQAAR
jgi:two-component system sensor histidine kinase QseC